MSYILEALKKSGEDRARLTTDDIRSVAATASLPAGTGLRSHRPVWLWLAVAGLSGLAALAIFIWSDTPQTARVPDPTPTPELAGADSHPVSGTRPSASEQTAPPVEQSAPASPIAALQAAAPAQSNVARKPSAPARAPVPPPQPAPAPPPAAATVQTAATEMPPKLLRQVLAIPVMAHMYSGKPAERMVIVDGRAVHEGEMLAPGMSIEQITPSGIVIFYQGYRARKPVH